MTEQHYNLRLAMANYFKEGTTVIIPPHYHDHIVNAYNQGNLDWDADEAASLTLFSAYYDGVLKKDDLSFPGNKALQWAEQHIEMLGVK